MVKRTTNSVLIPAIAPSQNNSALLTTYTERFFLNGLDVDSEHKVLSIVGPLLPIQLASAGDVAVRSVRRLLKFHSGNTTLLERQQLHCSGRTEGESCQLAFALVLLASQQKRQLNFIATGKLGGINGQVTIEPVNHLQEKLSLVLREKQNGNLIEQSYWFFTPVMYFNPTDSSYHQVADLPEVAELANLNITVVPSATLNELANQFHLLPHLPRLSVWKPVLLILCCMFAVLFGLICYSVNQPIELKFDALEIDEKRAKQLGESPGLMCKNKVDKTKHYQPIKTVGINHHILYRTSKEANWNAIAWNLHPPTAQGLNNLLLKLLWRGCYLTVATINQEDGLLIYPLGKSKRYNGEWALREFIKPQNNVLVLLASYRPLDLTNIKKNFDANLQKKFNLTLAEYYLKKQADGAISFFYTEELQENGCNN
jgi:hypothetical protein